LSYTACPFRLSAYSNTGYLDSCAAYFREAGDGLKYGISHNIQEIWQQQHIKCCAPSVELTTISIV